MGRLLLLLVFAAALGGSVLALNTRDTLGASNRNAAESQADILAREIAEAGRAAALNAMIDSDGFRDPTRRLGDEQAYGGGQFRIEFIEGASDREATLRVSGQYAGAVHTVESSYAYDPMDAPGPMWLDVPYATANVSNRAKINGGEDDLPVQFDRRQHDDHNLEGLVPLGSLTANLSAAAGRAGSELGVPAGAEWTEPGGLLDHLNVDDAEGLYQKAIAAVDVPSGDLHRTGAVTFAGATTFGGGRDGEAIAFIDGDLTVTGRLRGEGALVVNGALRVPAGGRLQWTGLVIVRSTQAVLPIELAGTVDVDGMIVVAQQSFAPGGHLDVSVYRALGGMVETRPAGDLSEQVSPWRPSYPWHQHTHAFDLKPTAAPRGDHVYFLEGGRAGRHEAQVQLATLLSRLGNTMVYLEIANAENHGFSTFGLEVAGTDGTEGPIRGSVQGGFGDFARAGTPRRTRAFRASDLRNLDLDVQSLRALQQAFDDASCSSWPVCIGQDWDREDAMAVRLHRAADGARLYESTLYWHMREDEAATIAAEEAAWRARIEAGEAFGTRLAFGDNVDITFDIDPINALSKKLDFEGDRVTLVASRSFHLTPDESGLDPAPPATSGSGGAAPTAMCISGQNIFVPSTEVSTYLALGAVMGECSGESGESGGSEPSAGEGNLWVCHRPSGYPPTSLAIPVLNLPLHLLHGDYAGRCVSGDDD